MYFSKKCKRRHSCISSERDFIPFCSAGKIMSINGIEIERFTWKSHGRLFICISLVFPRWTTARSYVLRDRRHAFDVWLGGDTFSHRVVFLYCRQAEATYNPTKRRKERLTLSAFWNECQNLLGNFRRWSHNFSFYMATTRSCVMIRNTQNISYYCFFYYKSFLQFYR